MAEEVEMTPVEAAEPPKSNPLAKPTVSVPPVAKPVAGTATVALKPGLKLPPKPGATVALKPGLKLPSKSGATVALKPGLKLPPKPGATVTGLKPGLRLPTQTTLKPGVKLPPKPVIRKPGATVMAAPLPKPVMPATPADPAAPAASTTPAAPVAPAASAAPVPPAAPVAAAAPAAPVVQKPIPVDAQGVGKLPTVEAKAVARTDVNPVVSENPKPMDQLKSVTQKLKGVTQEIPQQAILHKTGIIADAAMSDAQKEAAKHKTARISLSDAMGVAPVKNENAPIKTIRIKRPVVIPTAATQPAPAPAPSATAPAAAQPAAAPAEEKPAEPSASMTQRKTLKIARPAGGAVRPAGKFGIKRPSPTQATTVPAAPAAPAAGTPAESDSVADIPDIPAIPTMPTASVPEAPASDGPAWLWTLSSLVQAAACAAIGALAWFLYQNTVTNYF